MHRVYVIQFHPGITENQAMDYLAALIRHCRSVEQFRQFVVKYRIPVKQQHAWAHESAIRVQLKERGVDLGPGTHIRPAPTPAGEVSLVVSNNTYEQSGAPAKDTLSRTIWAGDRDVISRIIRNGTSPDRVAEYKLRIEGTEVRLSLTPLGEVVWHYRSLLADWEEEGCELIRLLVDLGANPDTAMQGGNTPLHLAAGNWAEGCPSLRLFAALQDCGADPNIENNAGESARATLKENM